MNTAKVLLVIFLVAGCAPEQIHPRPLQCFEVVADGQTHHVQAHNMKSNNGKAQEVEFYLTIQKHGDQDEFRQVAVFYRVTAVTEVDCVGSER